MKKLDRADGEMMSRVRLARWLVTACVVGAASAASGEVIDRVLAVAAGQVLMLSDVTAARELGFAVAPTSGDPIRSVLTQLIDRELMLAEVDRYAPSEPSPDALERDVATVASRFASPAAYRAALARSGVDERQVREMVRQNLRIRAYIEQRFSAADARREALIDEWLTGLRRRGDVTDFYLAK